MARNTTSSMRSSTMVTTTIAKSTLARTAFATTIMATITNRTELDAPRTLSIHRGHSALFGQLAGRRPQRTAGPPGREDVAVVANHSGRIARRHPSTAACLPEAQHQQQGAKNVERLLFPWGLGFVSKTTSSVLESYCSTPPLRRGVRPSNTTLASPDVAHWAATPWPSTARTRTPPPHPIGRRKEMKQRPHPIEGRK